MKRILIGGPVKRTSQHLSINGDSPVAERTGKPIDPSVHGGKELPGVEFREHTTERVMTGDTFLELEISLKPITFGFGEAFNIGPTVGSTDRSGQCNEDHFEQIMIVPTIDSRVCNICKGFCNKRCWSVHRLAPPCMNEPLYGLAT